MSYSVLTDCPCTMFLLYMSTHIILVTILFFGWSVGTWLVSSCENLKVFGRVFSVLS